MGAQVQLCEMYNGQLFFQGIKLLKIFSVLFPSSAFLVYCLGPRTTKLWARVKSLSEGLRENNLTVHTPLSCWSVNY